MASGSSDEYLAKLGFDTSDVDASVNSTITLLGHLGEAFPQVQRQADTASRALGSQTTAAKQAGAANEEAAKKTANYASQLPRLRYALYDVSFAAAIAGAGLVAGGVAAESTAISYERLFANVERTSKSLQDNGPALAQLRSQLLDITSAIPASFADITNIATLGNQLNIPAQNLAAFTKVVAEFSATTNVGVNDAATAFGRLGQLLHTTDYKALGDDIAYLGVNAVATESQIIKTSQNIAVVANAAGFTKEQVLALATAVSSLGISPEQARGGFVRAFSQIQAAVNGGGAKLNDLAAISGKTSQQFATQWKTNAAGAFRDFVTGLGGDPGNIKSNLAALNITATRDVQTFGLLSQNTNVLDQALQDVGHSSGYLDKSFDAIANTTSSKLVVAGNNFSRLLDTIGQQTNGPVKIGLDALNGVLGYLNKLLQDPGAAGGVAITLTLTTIAGAGALLLAVFLRLAATMLAIKSAGIAGAEGQGVLATAFDVVFRNGSRLAGSNAAVIASEEGLAAAGASAAAGQDAAAASSSGLASAGGKLSGALGKAGLIGSLLALLPVLPAFFEAIQQGVNQLDGAASTVDNITLAIERLTAKANVADADKLNKLLTLSGTPDGQGAFTTVTSGGVLGFGGKRENVSAGRQALNQSKTGQSFGAGQQAVGGNSADVGQQELQNIKDYDAAISNLVGKGEIPAAQKAIDLVTASLKKQGLSTKEINSLLPLTSSALGAATGQSLHNAAANKQAAVDATDAASAFKDYMDAAFGASNAQAQLQTDLGSLGSAFATNGASIASSGSEIQAVISDIYASSASAPEAAAQLQGFFNALVAGGFASANQLAGLQGVIYQLTGGKGVQGATFSLDSFNKGLATTEAKAAKAAGGTGKLVHTLVDYANDLSNVFKRSFDIRFGNQESLDSVTSKWADLAKSISTAQSEISKYQATMDQLTADKAVQQYWLSVAENYGDALRAGQLRASIADLDNQLTDTSHQLTAAQDANSKTLIGNSDAAIKNRSDILGLVSGYESYLQSLAASGASQGTLSATAAQLKQQFISQAQQLGFNTNELGTYASAFDDVSKAIARVPRNITVTANTDPALQALNEFVAQATKAGGAAGSGFAAGLNQGVADAYGKAARGAIIMSKIASYGKYTGNSEAGAFYTNLIAQLSAQLASGNYRSGGWTGDGNPWEVAGITHKNEYVLNETGASLFPRSQLDAANQGRAPSGGGGAGTVAFPTRMVVELSPTDRALISQGADVTVVLAADTVGAASSASFKGDSNRGAS